MKRALALSVALIVMPATASTWINTGGFSLHTKSGLNSNNPGLGIEQDISPRAFIALGKYRNSFTLRSHYLVGGWRLICRGPLSFGAVMGVIDGYPYSNHGGARFLGAPYMAIEGEHLGLNLLVIPPEIKNGVTAFAVQFKVKIQ